VTLTPRYIHDVSIVSIGEDPDASVPTPQHTPSSVGPSGQAMQATGERVLCHRANRLLGWANMLDC
jgi:hypothetical protein